MKVMEMHNLNYIRLDKYQCTGLKINNENKLALLNWLFLNFY